MENKYIYIDESGDTGYTKKSTRYFILIAVIVEDGVVLNRIVKKIHKSKINKKDFNVLHTYKETNNIKKKILKNIENLNIKSIVFVIDKNNLKIKDPYFYLLQKSVVYFKDNNLNYIILAKRDTRKSYNDKIIELFNRYKLKLILSNPLSEKNLQIADFYSFIVFKYLEHNDQEYFDKLKSDIIFI